MDGNNILDILIRFGLDKSQAPAAAAEITKLKTATTEAGVQGVKAEEQVQAATKQTFTSKKQLKDMVKGLTNEFPLLGHIAHMALNPIVLLTASAAASFALWNQRLAEATKGFGGITMPDITEDQIKRIDRMADAWGKFAEKLGATAGKSTQLRSDLAAVQQLLKMDASMRKALGVENAEDKAAQSRILTTAAAALEAEGQRKLKAAGTPMSTEEEKAQIDKQHDMAVEAEKAQAASRKWQERIMEWQTGKMSMWDAAVFGGQYAIRYGAATTGGAATKQEDANIANAQVTIDQYRRLKSEAGTRVGRRTMAASGAEDIAEAGRMRVQAGGLAGEDITSRASAANDQFMRSAGSLANGLQSGGLGELARAASEMAKAAQMFPQIANDFKMVKKEIVEMRKRLDQQPPIP